MVSVNNVHNRGSKRIIDIIELVIGSSTGVAIRECTKQNENVERKRSCYV